MPSSLPKRRHCAADRCGQRAEFGYDVNLGMAPAEREQWCPTHLGPGLAAALARQADRGDQFLSILVEVLPRLGRPPKDDS